MVKMAENSCSVLRGDLMNKPTFVRASDSTYAHPTIASRILLTIISCVGCNTDIAISGDESALSVAESREATKPSGSQDCQITGREVLGLSLPEDREFSQLLRVNDVIPLRVTKDIALAGTLMLDVVVNSVDTPDSRVSSNHAIGKDDGDVIISVPISLIGLPTHPLEVSRFLTIHGKFVVDGGRYEAARSVRLFFHPQFDGWQFYDEDVRDRDYHGGALTAAERAKRAAALESLPSGISARYVTARVTKLSDDPAHIPPDDATMNGAAP